MFKKFLFTIFASLVLVPYAVGQEYMTDKGSKFAGVSLSFTSSGGDLYGYGDDRVSMGTLAGTYNYFIAKQFFIGGSLGVTYQSVGDSDGTTISAGPQLGVAFGKPESKTFPFLSVGYRYDHYSVGDESVGGGDIAFSAGFIVQAADHLGVTIEAGYHIKNVSSEGVSVSGNIIMLGVGLTGLLY